MTQPTTAECIDNVKQDVLALELAGRHGEMVYKIYKTIVAQLLAAQEIAEAVYLENVANDGSISLNQQYEIFKQHGWNDQNELWEVWIRNKRRTFLTAWRKAGGQ